MERLRLIHEIKDKLSVITAKKQFFYRTYGIEIKINEIYIESFYGFIGKELKVPLFLSSLKARCVYVRVGVRADVLLV